MRRIAIYLADPSRPSPTDPAMIDPGPFAEKYLAGWLNIGFDGNASAKIKMESAEDLIEELAEAITAAPSIDISERTPNGLQQRQIRKAAPDWLLACRFLLNKHYGVGAVEVLDHLEGQSGTDSRSFKFPPVQHKPPNPFGKR